MEIQYLRKRCNLEMKLYKLFHELKNNINNGKYSIIDLNSMLYNMIINETNKCKSYIEAAVLE